MARPRSVALVTLASLVGLVLAVILVALSPLGTGVLVPYAAERAARAAGVRLELGDVSGALWGDVKVRSLAVRADNGMALTLDTLTFGLDLLPLISREVRVTPLRLEGGRLRLPLPHQPADTAESPANPAGWVVDVRSAAVRDFSVVVLHAPWVDRVLQAASLDTVATDSLVFSDILVSDVSVHAGLADTLTWEIAIPRAGIAVAPLGLSVRTLEGAAWATPDTIRFERVMLDLGHGRVEARGHLLRNADGLYADVRIDSLESRSLGAFEPAEARDLSLSARATVTMDREGRWRAAVAQSILRDLRGRGTIEATGAAVRTPDGRWPDVTADLTVTALATERIPGGDTLLPPGAIEGTLHADGPPRALRVAADLRLVPREPVGPPHPRLTARGALSFRNRLWLDSMRAAVTTPLAVLGFWLPERYLPAGVATVEAVASGPLDSLRFHVAYRGEQGRATAAGLLRGRDSLWTLADLRLSTTDLDLHQLVAPAPTTAITLTATGGGAIVSGSLRSLRLEMTTDSSTVDGRPFQAWLAGAWDGRRVAVESLTVSAPGLALRGRGGLSPDGADSITATAEVTSLRDAWPLLTVALTEPPFPADSVSGRVTLRTTVRGPPARPRAEFDLQGGDLRLGPAGARRVTATGTLDRDLAGAVNLELDSALVAGQTVERLTAAVTGSPDSATAALTARQADVTLAARLRSRATAAGVRGFTLDSLRLDHAGRVWRARPGAVATIGDGAVRVDSLVVDGPGGGELTVNGAVAREDTTAIRAEFRRIPLAALEAVTPVDSGTFTGTLSGTVRLAGPLASPTGSAALTVDSLRVAGESVGVLGVDVRVTARGTDLLAALGADSGVVLDGRVPLSISGDPFRVSFDDDGAMDLRIAARDADLRRLEPLLVNVEQPRGRLSADVRIGGTWGRPVMDGTVTLRGGHARVPALGVTYDSIRLAAAFEGSRARIDTLLLRTGDGRLRLNGAVDLAPLDDPTLDLTVDARDFRVMDDPEVLTLTASGGLTVSGRLRAPAVTGRIRADEAVLRMGDLGAKSIVDLDDPLFASVVDTMALRTGRLEPGLLERMRDSLALDSVIVSLGSDVWLRSDDVNIQLGGEAAVSKTADRYRVFGTLTAGRGTYQLALGPATTREFRIQDGSVRFFGSPRTDATLDINASHTVRTYRGERIDVFAHIGGTIAEPEVTLSSSLGPRVSDTEVISYLLFGAPSVQVFAGRRDRRDQSLFQRSAQQLTNVLSGTLERSLTGSLGVPLDYLRIEPGDVGEGFSGTEIMVGKQLDLFGRPAFLTASPRLCPGQGLVRFRRVGASLETWLAAEWLVALSLDPVHGCEGADVGTSSYSVGVDVFWEKH